MGYIRLLIDSVNKLKPEEGLFDLINKISKTKDIKKKYPDLNPTPAEIVMGSTIKVMKNDGNAAFVKSSGLQHKGDHTHFDAESYRKLGKRYARAMMKLQKK